MPHVIALNEDLSDGVAAYWVTRVCGTDNYSCEVSDATIFADRISAYHLMKTLSLEDDNHIEEI